MKATWLLSLAMSGSVLMHGTGYAGDRYHPRSRAGLAPAKHPKPLPDRRKAGVSGPAVSLHRPGADRTRIALPVRLPGVGRSTLSSPGMVQSNRVRPNNPGPSTVRPDGVRHRSPNPAVIGGSVNVASRNSGAIDGTRIYRRP
jgi:hypothetical protein